MKNRTYAYLACALVLALSLPGYFLGYIAYEKHTNDIAASRVAYLALYSSLLMDNAGRPISQNQSIANIQSQLGMAIVVAGTDYGLFDEDQKEYLKKISNRIVRYPKNTKDGKTLSSLASKNEVSLILHCFSTGRSKFCKKNE